MRFERVQGGLIGEFAIHDAIDPIAGNRVGRQIARDLNPLRMGVALEKAQPLINGLGIFGPAGREHDDMADHFRRRFRAASNFSRSALS